MQYMSWYHCQILLNILFDMRPNWGFINLLTIMISVSVLYQIFTVF